MHKFKECSNEVVERKFSLNRKENLHEKANVIGKGADPFTCLFDFDYICPLNNVLKEKSEVTVLGRSHSVEGKT